MPPEPPVQVRLHLFPPVECPYLPDRLQTLRGVMASRIDAGVYKEFMDAGFRRSGRLLYQPVCEKCAACVPLRVVVEDFTPSDSQKRCVKKNQDLIVTWAAPQLTDEKIDLYSRYVQQWHRRSEEEVGHLESFLYDSPTDTLEFEYRDSSDNLLAVGICDVSSTSLSSVYFYFDPEQKKRSLGTFGAVYEIAWAKERGLKHYYLGYWVDQCRTMTYKTSFYPHELMDEQGRWQGVSRF